MKECMKGNDRQCPTGRRAQPIEILSTSAYNTGAGYTVSEGVRPHKQVILI
jgi:hypothetical protein